MIPYAIPLPHNEELLSNIWLALGDGDAHVLGSPPVCVWDTYMYLSRIIPDTTTGWPNISLVKVHKGVLKHFHLVINIWLCRLYV